MANAALPGTGPIDDFSPEEIDRALDVNLRAPDAAHARAAAGHGRARARAPGLHVLAVGQDRVARAGGIYSATKFGMRGFAGGVREDLHDTAWA